MSDFTRQFDAPPRPPSLDAPVAALDARFRYLADALPQLVWTASPTGVVEYYNSRSAEYAGIRQIDVGLWEWEAGVHPDDLELTTIAWLTAVRTGETYQCEHRVRMADGTFRWHLSRAVPILDNGRVVQWFGTATDIHSIKEAEAELQQASRNKDEFLALLAHELRNPLAPMRNALELLRGDTFDEQQRRLHAILDRQVSHMVRLVEDLLEISRISRGDLRLVWEDVDLRDCVAAALELAQPFVRAANHTLTVEQPDKPVRVHGDSVRLSQAVGNLLNNAAKFTPAGGTVSVRMDCDGPWVRLAVRDEGIGIEPELLARVFDMFTQGAAKGQPAGGLGIGLALVRRIVELHGGRVAATSAGTGRGSAFEICLPLIAPVSC